MKWMAKTLQQPNSFAILFCMTFDFYFCSFTNDQHKNENFSFVFLFLEFNLICIVFEVLIHFFFLFLFVSSLSFALIHGIVESIGSG